MPRFALPALLLPALMMIGGCATTPQMAAQEAADMARDEARLAERLAGFTPGAPVSCIRPINADLDIFGDTLVYREGGNRLFRVKTSGGCFGLRRDDIVITNSFQGGQLCRGDLVRTADRTNGFPSGACSFGDFIPYTKAPRG